MIDGTGADATQEMIFPAHNLLDIKSKVWPDKASGNLWSEVGLTFARCLYLVVILEFCTNLMVPG